MAIDFDKLVNISLKSKDEIEHCQILIEKTKTHTKGSALQVISNINTVDLKAAQEGRPIRDIKRLAALVGQLKYIMNLEPGWEFRTPLDATLDLYMNERGRRIFESLKKQYCGQKTRIIVAVFFALQRLELLIPDTPINGPSQNVARIARVLSEAFQIPISRSGLAKQISNISDAEIKIQRVIISQF